MDDKNLYSAVEFNNTLKAGKVMKYNDRKKVEILVENLGRFDKGKEYEVHSVKADFFISKKFAKEVTKKK